MTKLAILLQYLRIFVPNKQTKTYSFTQCLIWTNFILYIVLGFCAAFMCSPRERIWNPLVPGKCLSLAGILIAGGVINIFSDFCVLALPLTSIWQLQMATRHKIGISAVFAVGLLYVQRHHTSHQFDFLGSGDRLALTIILAHASLVLCDWSQALRQSEAKIIHGI